MKKKVIGFIADSLIIIVSFYIVAWHRYHTVFIGGLLYKTSVYFYCIFILLSLFANKHKVLEKTGVTSVLYPIALSNLIILTLFILLGRFIFPFTYYRFTSLYAVILVSLLEVFGGFFLVIYNRAKNNKFPVEMEEQDQALQAGQDKEGTQPFDVFVPGHEMDESYHNISEVIAKETSRQTLEFISQFYTPSIDDALIISTTSPFNLLNRPKALYKLIINLKRINDIQYINKFFETVNSKLEPKGIFIGWVETFTLRKQRILDKYPQGTNYLIYSIDFIFHRIMPKVPLVKRIYFFITRGQNRVLSKAETFGRLYSCGFEIVTENSFEGHLYFVVVKVKEPVYDNHPTYGPLIKLPRLGKGGKIISVYKLRTMHAYSEYLQGYVFQQNKLQSGGKFKNDFRVTTLGRFFRKFWLDELPMLINLLRGDIKLVGVRPLSKHYYSLYTKELQEKRISYKPGLIPPFYADMPRTLEEIMTSEMKYLESYQKNPFTTDVRYFFKALYNILFRKARSN